MSTSTFDIARALIIDAVSFEDKNLESKVERVISYAGLFMQHAMTIDQVKGDDDPTEQLEGLVGLAKTFGSSNLSAEQYENLKSSVRKVVTNKENPELEAALEESFISLLDLEVSCFALNDYITNGSSDNEEKEEDVEEDDEFGS